MDRVYYPATLLCDFYKVSHKEQYPANTEKIYSTWTPRATRMPRAYEVVSFGFQAFIKEYLIKYFNEMFFNRNIEDVVLEYKRVLKFTLGIDDADASHIEDLHKLGYLPIKIMAAPEGTLIPIRVPMLTIENTDSKFFWLTNYLETLMSCQLWQPITSATIAFEYRKILEKYAKETVSNVNAVGFQGHDFSMRGMSSLETAKASGAGHLLSFEGTDTIPAIMYMEEFYNANIENELIGTSIPATEHSVQCSYGKEDELETYKHLITNVYPKGYVSIVSDTWDLWNVLTETIPALKEDIMARDGKVVIRPDSGDPVSIICGNPHATNENERKGVVEILWETFGGTITDKGYKLLDSHIGVIYGDAITLDRCIRICEGLKAKGFASTNMVYGIGSFTYQYNTRDTFGFALKTTYAIIDGTERKLFKDPVTDKEAIKKSQKGLVIVKKENDDITYVDDLTLDEYKELIDTIHPENVILKEIFVDGKLIVDEDLATIRERLRLQL